MEEQVHLASQAMAWLQKKSTALLILPFLHLCVCFLYLSVYFTLFGHGLSVFADTGDVFSVSFTNIVPFYFSMLVGITGNSYIDFRGKEIEHLSRGCLIVGVIVPLVLLVIYWIALVINEYMKTGFILLWFVWFAALLCLINFIDFVLHKKDTRFKTRVFVIGWVLTSLVLTAAVRAQRDQYMDYTELVGSAPLCHDGAIVNKLGDQYLVVRPDNSRWLTDAKCQLGARLAPAPKRTFPKHWSFKFWPF